MRIILSVTNDLVTDQRVHRSCMALVEVGHNVTLVGRLLPESLPINRPYHTRRMRLIFRKKAVFYAEYNIRLFFLLLFSHTDLFYANDTDSLPANYWASRIRRKPLFFDAHEMFPEVPELVGRPRVKAFWTKIEDRYIPRVDAAITVCQSIADIYAQRYGIQMQVVRNVPLPRIAPITLNHPIDKQGRNLLLYQGAVNLGRGIEPMLDTMPLLPDCLFVIAGIGDKYNELQQQVIQRGLDNQIIFLGRLPLEELQQVTRQADLGISFLENLGLNYYYSLPNRISDFVQAGVPIVATDFPEIRRVIEGYGIGTLVPNQITDHSSVQPQQLADIIHSTLDYWKSITPNERLKRFEKAAHDLSWENDKKVLLSQLEVACHPKGH